jgi:tight adherence protein B
MLYLAALMTLLTVALGFAGVRQLRSRSRLSKQLLAERDPLEQQATAIQLPGLLDRLEKEAKQAGFTWTRRTFLLLWGTGVALGAIMWLMGDSLSGMLIPAVAVAGPLLWIQRRARVRTEAFANQLPQALTLMANVIRAGNGLYQAVGAVTRQMPDPIRAEFIRVERAIQLQVPVADAMAAVRDRIGVPEFGSVVIACKVAGEAGAELDKVLEAIARELVEDRQFIKVMQAASSEGRASARMVTGVPLFVMGAIAFLNPAYIKGILQDRVSLLLVAAGCVMILVGWLIIKRISDVRNW